MRRGSSLRGQWTRSSASGKRQQLGSSSAFRGLMANGVETTAGKPDPREQFEIAAEGLSRAEIESRAYHRTLEQNLYAYRALHSTVAHY